MHVLATVLIGGLVGWLAYWQLGLNAHRGTVVSVVLGVAGALVGVEALAPMFVSAPADHVSAPSALFAGAAAAVTLLAANFVYKRWGF